MVSAPVKSAPVNDPKNEGTPGAQVRMMAPKKSGTIIMPPGIRSIVRLMGNCTMAGLAGAGRRADLVCETCCSSACNSTSRATFERQGKPRGEAHAQEQALDVRDRLPGRRHRRGSAVLEPGGRPR